MPRSTNTKIMKKHLIVCEGRDEEKFLIRWLNSRALSDVPEFSNDVQVIDFGGNSELSKMLKILRNTEYFETVKSLLIIRDAESDGEAAVREIQNALRKADFPIPSKPHLWEGERLKIGFVLFPACDGNYRNGTLEDLCLTILSEPQSEDILQEIDSLLTLLKSNYHREFPRIFKTKLHTYFSVSDNYVGLKIGEAADVGAFEWSSTALTPLKDFLAEVF